MPMPCAQRCVGDAWPENVAMRISPRLTAIEPEERAQQFGSSRADESGDAEHLAAPKLK